MTTLLKYILTLGSVLMGTHAQAVITSISNNEQYYLQVQSHTTIQGEGDLISIFERNDSGIDLLNPIQVKTRYHNNDPITAALMGSNGYYIIGTQQGNMELYKIDVAQNELQCIETAKLSAPIFGLEVSNDCTTININYIENNKIRTYSHNMNTNKTSKIRTAKLEELPDETTFVNQAKKQTKQKKHTRINKNSTNWYTSLLNSCKKIIINKYFYIGSAITGYLMYKWLCK